MVTNSDFPYKSSRISREGSARETGPPDSQGQNSHQPHATRPDAEVTAENTALHSSLLREWQAAMSGNAAPGVVPVSPGEYGAAPSASGVAPVYLLPRSYMSAAHIPSFGDVNPCTDMGNALRLLHYFGEGILYCAASKSWLLWNETHWVEDLKREIEHLAKQVVQKIKYELGFQTNDDDRRRLQAWIKSSQTAARIEGMLKLAASDPSVAILPAELDSDKTDWLLNLRNGTYDLGADRLLLHDRNHRIMRYMDVDFDPEASCPRFREFLSQIFNNDTSLIEYVQRAFGAALTGFSTDDVLLVFYGAGANGKSTLLNVVKSILGDYALSVQADTLMQQRTGAIRTDLARLKGARLVVASESDEVQQLSEAIVKQLTGGDTIVARFLYGKEFEFTPKFTLVLATNHLPNIRGVSDAIWRRVKLIPFSIVIPKENRDPHLEERLLEERAGILNWLVDGCRAWKQCGLNTNLPAAVWQATESYKVDTDRLSEFINECCVVPGIQSRTSDTYRAYVTWSELNSEPPVSKRAFVKMMEERGYKRRKSNFEYYTGIALTNPPKRNRYGHEVQYAETYTDNPFLHPHRRQ